jgi:hypothetical protein
LKEEFDWFLGEEFNTLLEGFEPSDNSEFVKAYCKKFDISFEEKRPPSNTEPIIVKTYDCYECRRANHGTPIYQTDSLSDYQRHWLTSGHKGPCQPGRADLRSHGWEAQGKEWEI